MCEDDREYYNYGYRDSNSEFRTITAGSCLVGQCDNVTIMDGCDRVQRFSSNETLYNGKIVGDDRIDNAKVLNDARAIVASFYPAMGCVSDQHCDDQIDTTLGPYVPWFGNRILFVRRRQL
jgi:hypothetical protein